MPSNEFYVRQVVLWQCYNLDLVCFLPFILPQVMDFLQTIENEERISHLAFSFILHITIVYFQRNQMTAM